MGKIKVWTIKSVWTVLIFSNVLFLNFAPVQAAPTFTSDTIVQLTNQARTQNGLGELKTNTNLASAAFAKAQDILAKGYFAHNAPDGKTPWDFIKEAGYNYTYAGENLAIGYTDANELFTAWMNSPTHRDNIIGPNYREIGVSVVEGQFQGNKTIVVVQEFGTRADEASQIAAPNVTPTPGTSVAPQNQNFQFIANQSSVSPQSIFAGEYLEIKVTANGEIKTLQAKIFNETYNLLESATVTGSGKTKTYTIRQKVSDVGTSEVLVVGTGQGGNTETVSLGQVEVKEPNILKPEAQNTGLVARIKNSLKNDWLLYLMGLSLVILVLVGVRLSRRSYKFKFANWI